MYCISIDEYPRNVYNYESNNFIIIQFLIMKN